MIIGKQKYKLIVEIMYLSLITIILLKKVKIKQYY